MLTAGVLGSGILILPSIAANIAGESSVIAWALMTVLAVPIALTFGLLASHYPSAAGIAEYAKRALGARKFGWLKMDSEFLVGTLFLSVIPTATPIVILAGALYAASFFGCGFEGAVMISLAMLAAIFTLNTLGIKLTAGVQLLISVCVVLVLLAISLPAIKPVHLNISVGWSVGMAMVAIFWSYMGWEAATHLSEEFRKPSDFYKAILTALAVVGGVYLLVSYAVVTTHSYGEGLEGLTSLIAVSSTTFGIRGAAIVALLAVLTCFSSANIYISSSSRLLFALARDGYMPRIFAKVNGRGAPCVSLAAVTTATSAVLLALLVIGEKVEGLILLSNGVFVILYLIGAVSGLMLLKNKLVPALALIVCATMLVFAGINVLYPFAVAAVAVIYTSVKTKDQQK